MADFLLHSMSEFSEIFDAVFEAVSPKILVEIGSEYGGSTKILLDYAKEAKAFLHVIDPSPYTDLKAVFYGYEEFYKHHREKSIHVLPSLPAADVYFVDGDHNYWTVKNELEMIRASNKDAWIILHDVAYPCARRDLYYCPADIPSEAIHSYTYKEELDADNNLTDCGFGGAGHFAFSKNIGGARNGVLTAIEDFISETPDSYFSMIKPIFGLGIIAPIKDTEKVDDILSLYKSGLIEKMEKNRLELYVQVLRLQRDIDYLRSPLASRVFRKIKAFL